jgi:hypothetical protein
MKSMKKLSATVAKNMMAKPKTAGTVAARVTAKRLSGQGTGLAAKPMARLAKALSRGSAPTARMKAMLMAKPKTAGTVAARVTAKRLSGQGTGLARPKAVKMARQMEKPMKATAKMARQMEKPMKATAKMARQMEKPLRRMRTK